ncbi:MAG: hypothetical protein LIR50_15075 [Bacillota bacterium]|nr:hypothetical protein [Bacillota bacterium]
MINNEYYVYKWYIEDTNEIFYIGKGKNDRYKRIKNNKFFRDMYNTHKCNVRIIYNNLTEKEAFKKESELIYYYKNNFPQYRLTNQTNGGEGTSGWKPTKEFKKKQSKIHKAQWQNQEFKNKISKLVQGKNNPLYKNESNPNAKKIMCLETGGIFECIKYCMEKYDIKSESSITVALKERQKTAGNKHWIKINNDNINYFLDKTNRFKYLLKSILLNKRQIGMICIEDKTIYNNKVYLAKELKISIHIINYNINKFGKLIYNNKTYMKIEDYGRIYK